MNAKQIRETMNRIRLLTIAAYQAEAKGQMAEAAEIRVTIKALYAK